MDVGSLNAQMYSPMPERRPVEPVAEPVAEPALTVGAVGKQEQIAVPERPEEKEVNGLAAEDLNDRQLEDMLSKGIKEANKKLALTTNELQYSYHKPTRSVAVKVINTATKEVVREIPPQEALDALAKVWELAGILVDEKK